MKYLKSILVYSVLSLAGASAFAAPPQMATQLPEKLPAKKTSAKAQKPAKKKSSVAKATSAPEPSGRITVLPAYKGKKRVSVTFRSSNGASSSTGAPSVVVRSMSIADYNSTQAPRAGEATEIRSKKIAAPLPVETIQVTDAEAAILDAVHEDESTGNAKATQPSVATVPEATPNPPAQPTPSEVQRPYAKLREIPLPVQTPPPPEVVGPPVPQILVIETPSPKLREVAPMTAPAAKTTERLALNFSYLNSQFNRIQNDLQNGATSVRIGMSHKLESLPANI